MDIKLIKNNLGQFTISLKNGDLERDEGFETAINLSLFSDARAPAAKVNQPDKRRGWIGDVVSPVDGRIYGSWLWLLNQRKLTPNTLNQYINFAQLALDWFVIDGLATSVKVSGIIVPRLGIQLEIVITSLTGSVSNQYVDLWEITGSVN